MTNLYKRRFNYMLSETEAKAMEAEERNNTLFRFDINDLAEAIKEATGAVTPPYANPANAIPYHVSHAVPTPLAKPDEELDKIRAAEANNGDKDALLAAHAAYIGEDASDKKSYALIHHSGPLWGHKCYLKSVKSCLKALGVKADPSGIIPTDHPLAAKNAAVSHLLKHLEEFKAQAEAQKEE